jgi:hypothetical protein
MLALARTFAPVTERLLLWRNRRLQPKTAFSRFSLPHVLRVSVPLSLLGRADEVIE